MSYGITSREDALKLAWDKIAFLRTESVVANAGVRLGPGAKQLALQMLDRECVIDLGAKTVKYTRPKETEVSKYHQVLILHYLDGAGNAQLANRLVTFREFEGGALYFPAFKTRAIDPIVREFSSKPDLLRHIGDALRAEPTGVGSVGFKAHFFPKMPVAVTLWLGDEEVPPSANLLFDANAGKILPTEDLSVVGGTLTKRLLQLAKP